MTANLRGVLVLLVSILLGACGGGDDADGDDAPLDAAIALDAAIPVDAAAPDGTPAARLEATIEYDGAAEGTLLLAAFTSFPPQGPPIAFAQDSAPVFPASLALEELAPQTLYVLAFLDVAPASPTQPGPEDLTAWSDALDVEIGETTTVTLILADP